MNKMKAYIYVAVILFAVSVADLNAQSFFSKYTTKSNKDSNEPTVITSDSMDFDITKNVAVFTGNVQVDDANMRILCHKMIIRFEGKAGDIKNLGGADNKKTKIDDKKEDSTTKVKEIECIKNVIIIRKLYDEKEKKEGEQKAIAGHAIYDVKTGKITLSENPALIRGGDTVRGEVIIYYIHSERVSVRSGKKNASELKIRSTNTKEMDE